MADELEALYGRMDKEIRDVFPGVKRVYVSSGGSCQPLDGSFSGIIGKMRDLKSGELLLESAEEKLLIVRSDYGDIYAIVCYLDDIPPVDVSRLIQLVFARRKSLKGFDVSFMPASSVEILVKRWEHTIGLVFGRGFARKLIEGAFSGKNKGTVTPEDLERIRASISSKLGDCLLLDKVHK
jgi:hypothetical protein